MASVRVRPVPDCGLSLQNTNIFSAFFRSLSGLGWAQKDDAVALAEIPNLKQRNEDKCSFKVYVASFQKITTKMALNGRKNLINCNSCFFAHACTKFHECYLMICMRSVAKYKTMLSGLGVELRLN